MVAQMHLAGGNGSQYCMTSRRPRYSLCLQSDRPDDGQSQARRDKHRKRRTRAIFGDPKRQMYQLVVAAHAREEQLNETDLNVIITVHERTSLSAFSLFKASIAAISRMDSSTFPCSPEVL